MINLVWFLYFVPWLVGYLITDSLGTTVILGKVSLPLLAVISFFLAAPVGMWTAALKQVVEEEAKNRLSFKPVPLQISWNLKNMRLGYILLIGLVVVVGYILGINYLFAAAGGILVGFADRHIRQPMYYEIVERRSRQ